MNFLVKKTLLFFAIFLINLLFAQQKITILDAETKLPIPFAKIIFENSYRNTEENGEITLTANDLIKEIEAFGYEKPIIEKAKTIYLLVPKPISIEEVVLLRPKNIHTFVLGKIEKKRSVGFGSSNTTWTVADFVKSETHFPKNLFIKKIRFSQEVKNKKNATIRLSLYQIENGKPSDEPWKSYIANCTSKNNIAELDLSKNAVPMPEEGIFIGFEWIINSVNTYQHAAFVKESENSKAKRKLVWSTNPIIHTQPIKSESNLWVTVANQWKYWGNFTFNKYREHAQIAMEVELTD